MRVQFGFGVAVFCAMLLAPAPLPCARAAGQPGVVQGRYKFVPWRLGVRGFNTNRGFVITGVLGNYPANNLLLNGRPFTLEPNDMIVEVDGEALTRTWTLQKALGYSTGRVDLRVWDDRAGTYRTFPRVRCVR